MGGCNTASNGQILSPISFEGLQIICRSWKKTYANLFDYTAPHNGIYQVVTHTNQPQPNLDSVIQIVNQPENGFLIKAKLQKSKQLPWIVVKTLPSKQYLIKQGDMIRIGKQKIRVKQVISKQQQQITAKGYVYQQLTKQGKPLSIQQQQSKNYQCRFCLQIAQIGNPVIAPCNCAGSSKYVHLRCVQVWLTKTINPRQIGKATAITWKPLVCELCNKSLPFKVYLDGKRYFTVNIPKPQKPYLVLNPIYKQKQPGKIKIYLLVSFYNQKQMKIGRKAQSDIILAEDSTVSRHHSFIIFRSGEKQNGNFYLLDNQSKFGTLVLVRKQIVLRRQLNGLCIQLGGDCLQLLSGKIQQNKKDSTQLGQMINMIQQVEQQQQNQQASAGQQQKNKNQQMI